MSDDKAQPGEPDRAGPAALGRARRNAVGAFFAGLEQGAFPDDLFAPAATFWTTASGPLDARVYRRVPVVLKAIFPDGLTFAVDRLLLDGDAAAAEVRSSGVSDDGLAYANSYAFFFGFAGARIGSVAEHLNPLRVPPALGERMQALLAG